MSANDFISAIRDQGWYYDPSFLPPELCAQLRYEVFNSEEIKLLHAGIGREQNAQENKDIRSDKTHWLDGSTMPQTAFLSIMENLQQTLNEELFLGLFSYECHYALYEPGAFYQKHFDSFAGRRNRILSTVVYLNEDWLPTSGGELLLFSREDQLLNTIHPLGGSAVFFLSEEFPHEVLPARLPRSSIAGWFRLREMVSF